MTLFTDSIRLGQPRRHFIIHFLDARESKSVEMISGRESFDAAKTRVLETPREDDVAVDPRDARILTASNHVQR
jgi:hypothetical protein